MTEPRTPICIPFSKSGSRVAGWGSLQTWLHWLTSRYYSECVQTLERHTVHENSEHATFCSKLQELLGLFDQRTTFSSMPSNKQNPAFTPSAHSDAHLPSRRLQHAHLPSISQGTTFEEVTKTGICYSNRIKYAEEEKYATRRLSAKRIKMARLTRSE